jgi:hypothetical protein
MMSLISKRRKKRTTNPKKIKYRQNSKTCTIKKKKSPQYKSAQTYSEILLNMTELEA